jgi:2-methylcitrate dehydratase PrpD
LRALASRVLAVTRRAGDRDVVDAVGRRVYDALGALAAGMTLRPLGGLDGAGEGLLDEVRTLCAAARCTELDDIDTLSCTTPGALAVPVALAVADFRDAGSEAIVGGVLAGYEAMIAVGEAVGGPFRLREGIWPAYLAAPVAAAAATAVVLRLGERRTAHALAIAMTRAAGAAGRIAREPTSRWLTFGAAAADGVLAALAAEAGLHGDAAVTPAGARAAYDPALLAAADGAPALLHRAEAKPFCTARQTLGAVEAAREAHERLGGGRPAEVVVGVPEAYRAMVDQPRPEARLATIASAQFQIGAGLAAPERLFDVARLAVSPTPAQAAVMDVVRVQADSELTALYPSCWPARVRMRDAGGRAATALVRTPPPSGGWDALDLKHARVGCWPHGRDEARALCAGLGDAPADVANRLLQLATSTRPHEALR